MGEKFSRKKKERIVSNYFQNFPLLEKMLDLSILWLKMRKVISNFKHTFWSTRAIPKVNSSSWGNYKDQIQNASLLVLVLFESGNYNYTTFLYGCPKDSRICDNAELIFVSTVRRKSLPIKKKLYTFCPLHH